jgi:hypothetical protein
MQFQVSFDFNPCPSEPDDYLSPWSLNSGQVSLAAVSKYLGHAKQSTTLDHYSHLMVGELEQVSKFWNERTG